MFFVTPKYCIVNIPRAGSCSIARGIIQTFYPHIKLNYTDDFCQDKCPKIKTPDRPSIALIRDPIERLKSAMAFEAIEDVDSILWRLEQPGGFTWTKRGVTRPHLHYATQSSFVLPETALYCFPDDIEKVCELAGIKFPLPWRNRSRVEKIELNPEQTARVKTIYAADVELYEGIE